MKLITLEVIRSRRTLFAKLIALLILIHAAVLSPQPIAIAAGATKVLAFGLNFADQAAVDTDDNNIILATPTKFSSIPGSISVAEAGNVRSFVVTENGEVYAIGSNVNGRAGLGTLGFTNIPLQIDTTNLAGKKVVDIDAGDSHTLIATDDGSVLSFGLNGNGRTGLGTSSGSTQIATPINAPELVGKKITQVSAGWDHSLILADDGSVFSFGRNNYGQGGLGGTNLSTLLPTEIDTSNLNGRKVTQVAAGYEYSLLLTVDGTVFSFGRNNSGKTAQALGSGSTLIATPIDESLVAGKKFTQVAAGGFHNLLLADDGAVYSAGWNFYGQTGINTTSGDTLVATPIDISALAGKSITQVAAGWDYSVLLADDGTVFSFGRNDNGRTGLGLDSGNTAVATPIDTINLGRLTVNNITAGMNHSFLIATGVPEPRSAIYVLTGLLVLQSCRRR